MKHIVLYLSILFIALGNLLIPTQSYSESKPKIDFYYGEGCPHCKQQKEFLAELTSTDPQVDINFYEIWNNSENQKRLNEAAENLGATVNGVPFTIINDTYHIEGYKKGYTDKYILELINIDLDMETDDNQKEKTTITTFFGDLNLATLSLPTLAITLGFIDGFNPCAMWTLLFLISLLVVMEDRFRRWALGIAFIVASAFVYFIFMVAWLNVLLYIGYLFIVRLIIGLVALIGGSYNLKKYFEHDTTCKVGDSEKRAKTFKRLGSITSNKNFGLALLGIIGLAFAVNLVELICSAGLPAIFTQILALNNLSGIEYYAYIALYILFFMIDDLLIFFIAMITLEVTGMTTKYVQYTRLIGGVLMIIIGILLVFKPGWLAFG